MTTEAAMEEARESATTLIDKMGERLSRYARAEVIFGDPVSEDGVTVIPVGKVRWGFGGGHGRGSDESADGTQDSGEGGGGGGGVSATPVGYIEISDGVAVYRPIRDITSMWPALVGGAIAFWIVLRALRGLVR